MKNTRTVLIEKINDGRKISALTDLPELNPDIIKLIQKQYPDAFESNGIYYFGTIDLTEKTDVTDPCYGRKEYCRLTLPTLRGKYHCFRFDGTAKLFDDGWMFAIHEHAVDSSDIEWETIGIAGVDSGKIGIFDRKPGLSGSEVNEVDKLTSDYSATMKIESRDAFLATRFGGDGIYFVDGLPSAENDAIYIGLAVNFTPADELNPGYASHLDLQQYMNMQVRMGY